MPVCIETIHHASGTVEKGTVLPADHPAVKDAPAYFDSGEEAAPVKSARKAPKS